MLIVCNDMTRLKGASDMKIRLLFIALFSVFMVLTACGTSTGDEDVKENDEKEVEQDNEENNESDGDDQADEDEEKAERMNDSGTFNGQADPHTIEIETSDGPTAFQLTMEARDLVEDLNPGDEVTYTFYKDGEQLVIESISKVDSGDSADANDKITETGTFNGQADPHTIEIETDDGPTAFQLTMEARDLVEDLNPGDEVTYTYYKDGEQFVIESIKTTD